MGFKTNNIDGVIIMAKVYKLGKGAFRAVDSKEKLESLGYISGNKAYHSIFVYLCNGTYDNGGLEKYKKYTKQLSELLDKVQIGEGHGIKYYYKNVEVMTFINSILNGDSSVSMFTLTPEILKQQGYISGTVVGQDLWAKIRWLKGKDTTNLSKIYEREFKKLRQTVSYKTVGAGHGARKYYLKSEVDEYLSNLTI